MVETVNILKDVLEDDQTDLILDGVDKLVKTITD
jgi:hypothetical protein